MFSNYLLYYFIFRKNDEEEKETKKDPATEAEVIAARQRETIPLEERIQMFKTMLIEKDVCTLPILPNYLIFLEPLEFR